MSTTLTSLLLHTLSERGFIQDTTDAAALDQLLLAETVPAYIGFDCTAPSLHVGSLVQIMMLRWIQKCGHKPIVLLGGGTTRIGDPSGKDKSRSMLDQAAIDTNKRGIQSVFAKYIRFGKGATDAEMVDNADWLDALNYISFLRDYGVHFSINKMLSFDSVKTRLEREQHLSFLEFNYMLLQAYDFVELYRRNGCRVQLGGSDQWGNIVSGIELGRRLETPELFGITSPLITTASGAKMGKTSEGAVWLDASMRSPYDYWQFWRNTHDQDVGRFLRLFTELPIDEIEKLESLGGQEINEAKIVLANLATTLAHGAEAAQHAAATAKQTFEQGAAAEGLPTIEIESSRLKEGIALFALLEETGISPSRGEARRLIRGQGARINDTVADDENRIVTLADASADGIIKLSSGKKKHLLVKAV